MVLMNHSAYITSIPAQITTQYPSYMNTTDQAIGTTRAIAAFTIGTVFFFYAFVQRVSPSVMTTELMSEFSVGASGIGLLSGMYFYTYASLQLPVGLLVDRYGARRLLVLSATLCALACIGFAMSSTLWLASLFRALIGGLVAFAFVGTLAIAAEFFSRSRFAMLTGFLLATGMVGAIAGQAPLRLLVEVVGWRNCFFILAIAAALLAVCSHLVIPPRRTNSVKLQIEDTVWQQVRQVIGNSQTLLCAVCGFGFASTMLAFAGLWAVPWLTTTKGFSQVDAGSVVSWLFVGVMIGSPLIGWVSDAIGRRKPVILVGIVICPITLLAIIYSNLSNTLILGMLFFLHGIGAGCMVVLMGLCREWNKPSHSATALGFVNMGIVSSGAVMQPVIGALLDMSWSGEMYEGVRVYSAAAYTFAFRSLVVVLVVATLAALLIKESGCQQRIH